MKVVIVLTGTVRPNVVGGNFSVDERMNMYLSTLRFYRDTIGNDFPIVFVENSDVDLSSWKAEFKDTLNLEILQFSPKDEKAYEGFDSKKGKGYNEYLMIKKGLLCSKNIQGCTHFLKITGRYSMLNIREMLREIERRCEDKLYMGDIKDTRIYDWMGRKNTCSGHWGDSRFFVSNIDFYKKELIDCYTEMNDYKEGMWAEDYFLRLSRKYRQDKRFIFRFRNQVQFDGVSGTANSSILNKKSLHQNSLRNIAKNKVRHILRLLFPYIWF